MRPKPIVSLCGSDELHARAGRFNKMLSELSEASHDLEDARRWNSRERFGSGFWSSVKPPVSTSGLVERVRELEETLSAERAAIVLLSEGSVKP